METMNEPVTLLLLQHLFPEWTITRDEHGRWADSSHPGDPLVGRALCDDIVILFEEDLKRDVGAPQPSDVDAPRLRPPPRTRPLARPGTARGQGREAGALNVTSG